AGGAGRTGVMRRDEGPWGHLVVGLGHARRRRPELALQHLSQSIELNPSFALGHAGLGYAMAVGGQPERGLQALEQAHRLSPRDPFLAIYAPIVQYMALFALKRTNRPSRCAARRRPCIRTTPALGG